MLPFHLEDPNCVEFYGTSPTSQLHRVVTPSLEGWTPLVGRVLIPDNSMIYSLVPLINQWVKGLPCAA